METCHNYVLKIILFNFLQLDLHWLASMSQKYLCSRKQDWIVDSSNHRMNQVFLEGFSVQINSSRNKRYPIVLHFETSKQPSEENTVLKPVRCPSLLTSCISLEQCFRIEAALFRSETELERWLSDHEPWLLFQRT